MKLTKKAIALILAATLAFTCGFGGVFAEDSSDDDDEPTYAELQQQRLELQKQMMALEDDIKSIKNDAEKLAAKKASLNERTANIRKQIENYKAAIELTQESLRVKQAELDEKQREMDETYEQFKQRMRAMYMSNNTTLLSTLLAANSYSEFLLAAEMMRRVTDHDTELMDKLTAEKTDIEERKAVIEEELARLESDKAELDATYDELAVLIQEANAAISAAQALKEAKQAEYDSAAASFAAIEEELEKLMQASNGEFIGGLFIWPVPGYSYISYYYGMRIHPISGKYSMHTGIDIAGYAIYGKKIVASNSGVVSAVRYYTTGYGYYAIVDHGGGVYTLYAHMSSIKVSVGDWVSQGDTIGYVGSTGNSTGPHLHFEIRINGNTVNPLEYVSP